MNRLEFESLRGLLRTASIQVRGSYFVPKIAWGINTSQCDGLVIELLSLKTLTALLVHYSPRGSRSETSLPEFVS